MAESGGTWGNAEEMPGVGALAVPPGTVGIGGKIVSYGDVDSMSCSATGDCTAGGYYAIITGQGPSSTGMSSP